jgi:RraA family protein
MDRAIAGDVGPAALASLVEAFKRSSTAVISDNLARLPGAIGIRPFHHAKLVMAGPALTVRVAAGDNRFIHRALDLAQPGDVIVVDGDGETSRALIGEIIITIAEARGAAGFVIDGAIRDSRAIAEAGLPCFARAAIHRGPFKNGPGQINAPVSIGGLIVAPGDIVVGDDDGVVAFPRAIAAKLLQAVHAQEAKEAQVLESIRNGTYSGEYAK